MCRSLLFVNSHRHETFIELTTILKKVHDIEIRLMEIEFISDDKDDEASKIVCYCCLCGNNECYMRRFCILVVTNSMPIKPRVFVSIREGSFGVFVFQFVKDTRYFVIHA